METLMSGLKIPGGLRFWITVTVFSVMASCSEEGSEPQKPSRHEGAVRPYGEVVGSLESHEVGPQGGTVKSANGMVELIIPAGALASQTTIGIQEIKNTAPNGSGAAFRLTPHDIRFEKPVAVSIYYNADSISAPGGLGIAYQDEEGIWYWPGTRAHDLTNQKVTVETDHFSDWSIFESLKLLPATAVVQPGGEVRLTAYGVFPEDVEEDLLTPLVEGSEGDLLTPLIPPEPVGLSEPVPLDVKYIKEWFLNGDGNLVPLGYHALYIAPQNIPRQNPVEVTLQVRLKNGSSFYLISRIIVGGSEIILNGGPYSNVAAYGMAPGAAGFDAKIGVTAVYFYTYVGDITIGVSLSFPGNGVGKRAWSHPDSFVATAQSPNSGATIAGTIDTPDSQGIHTGYIQVDRYDEVGGLITGSFGGGLTFINAQCGGCKTVGTIQGKFMAQRHY